MVPGGGGHSDGGVGSRGDGSVARGRVLAGLVLVFSGFWALVGVSLLLVSPFAASFSDDDSAADERQAMIDGAAAGAGLVAVAGWTAVAGTKHLRNRPRARLWTIVTFAVWAAMFVVFVVRTATGDRLWSDDEDTMGSARGGLVLQGINLAGCLAIIALATLQPSGETGTDQAPRPAASGGDGLRSVEPTPAEVPTTGAGAMPLRAPAATPVTRNETPRATAMKAGAVAGALAAVVVAVLNNPWSLIVPVFIGVGAGLAAIVGASIGSLIASITAAGLDPAEVGTTARLVVRARLGATWTVTALVANDGASAATLVIGTLACTVIWSLSYRRATSTPSAPSGVGMGL